MSNDVNQAVASAVLAVASGWTLVTCSDLKFARIGFGLYLVDGILGVIKYVLPRQNQFVTKSHNVLKRVTRPLYLPLIAAEAVLYSGSLEEKYAWCHLIFPGVYLGLTELIKKNVSKEIVDLSTILNCVSLGFSSYVKKDFCGGACALLNLAAFMGAKEDSMEFMVIVSVAHLAAAQFFKQVFKW